MNDCRMSVLNLFCMQKVIFANFERAKQRNFDSPKFGHPALSAKFFNSALYIDVVDAVGML